jgi:23S rRNA pseudouridine2605 synthase
MHPKNEIDKVYIAKINGFLTPSDIVSLKKGVVIDGKRTSNAKVKVRKVDKESKTSIVELIIHEGRNHQVKNMFNVLGYDVLKLKRERIAFLDVKSLKSGEYRLLNPKEIKQLYVLTQQKSTR